MKGAVTVIDWEKIESRILSASRAPLPDDYHKILASEMFGCKPEDVTPEQRQAAKHRAFMYVYGAAYGGGKMDRFSSLLEPSPEEKVLLKRWRAGHAQLREFWNRLTSMLR